ncbi:MAG: hypothetical protein ACBR50_21520 [Microcoleus sp.]
MDDVAGDRSSSRVACHRGFGDVGTRAIPYGIASLQGIFEKYVENNQDLV